MVKRAAVPSTGKSKSSRGSIAGAATALPAHYKTLRETTAKKSAPDSTKLLASANEASGPARNAWIAFLGLLAYLLVTLSGVADENLLLNSPVTMPIVNVKIPLFSFFLAAPFLFLLVHLSLLMQHAMLAHKYQHFSEAIDVCEEGQAREHPDRRLVHNYVFSQLLVGPEAPWPLRMLMQMMVFVTLILLPVLALLYFQIKFLPSHDVAVTHAHRIAILLDLALIFTLRPFITMPFLSSSKKKLSLGNSDWRWELSYWSLGSTVFLSLVVMSFSLLVVTIPQACFWPLEQESEGCFSLDRTTSRWWTTQADVHDQSRDVFAPTEWFFGQDEPGERPRNQKLFGAPWFHRNLQLSGAALIREGPSLEVIARYLLEGKTEQDAITDLARGLRLRSRDLRYADLSFVRLYKADLEGANLSGAQLQGADLRLVKLRGTQLQGAQLWGANLEGAELQGAQLQGANLSGAQLQGASLNRAQLQGADLMFAQLQGVSLNSAQLQGADLSGAQLQGAVLVRAILAGAFLGGAQLQGADLSGAQLQAVVLRRAQLQGANLLHAQLQGASLYRAQLQGAYLNEAQLQGADLSLAEIWQTVPPKQSSLKLAILMEGNYITPLDSDKKIKLKKLVAEAKESTLREALKERLRSLLDTGEVQGWQGTDDHQTWVKFSKQPKPDSAMLSEFLGRLGCEDGTGGYIIKGIAGRIALLDRIRSVKVPGVLSPVSPALEDYAILTAKQLLDEKTVCAAAEHLDDEMLTRLSELAAYQN